MSEIAPQAGFTDGEYPADPYPGTRPEVSFIHLDRVGHVLTPVGPQPSAWLIGDMTLDGYLRTIGVLPVADRSPVLAYGSNANPSKITWMREHLGLEGPVVVLRARCHGVAAVWSAGVRQRDGQRPAVIAGMPGVVEDHTVWLATPAQRRVLDQVEGRGERYRLAWIHAKIDLEGGGAMRSVLAYTARPEVIGQGVPVHLNRSPLLMNGAYVRCTDLSQGEALQLEGIPADSDYLSATEVEGEPVGTVNIEVV